MPKRNGQSNAISWMKERSDSTTEMLVAILGEDCQTNLQGVPPEMIRAVHTRALQNANEIVMSPGSDLCQSSLNQEGFTYAASSGRSSGQGDNGGKKTVTRRKRRTKSTPRSESSTSPDSEVSSEDATPGSAESSSHDAHTFA